MNTEEWLELLEKLNAKSVKVTTSSVTIKEPVTYQPLINIPLERLFELYGNLVLAGFTQDEALIITTGVANNARNE